MILKLFAVAACIMLAFKIVEVLAAVVVAVGVAAIMVLSTFVVGYLGYYGVKYCFSKSNTRATL